MSIESKVLVWLGAGDVKTPNMSFGNYDVVVLVEARQAQAIELQERFANQQNVKVVHATISSLTEKSDFFHYTLEEYSALSSVSGLKQFYPGLRLIEKSQVRTKLVDEILNDLICQPAEFTLVLDIIDINHLILATLMENELWQNINHINIPLPESSLYEGAANIAELTSLLTAQGFEISDCDTSDPDIPFAKLHRNPLWFELDLLKKQYQLQKAENQRLIDEHVNSMQTQKVEVEAAKSELTQSLEKKTIELQHLIEANKDLKASLIHEKELATQVTQQLESSFNQRLKELERSNLQKSSQIDSLKNEKLALIEQLKILEFDKQELVKVEIELKKSIEQQNQKFTDEIVEINAKLNQSNAEKKRYVSAFEAEKTELCEQLQLQSLNYKKLEIRIDELKAHKTEQEQLYMNDKVALNNTVSNLETQKAKAESENSELVKTLNAEKSESNSKLNALQVELDEMRKLYDQLSLQNLEVKASEGSLLEKVQDMEKIVKKSEEKSEINDNTHNLNIKLMTKLELDNEFLRSELSKRFKEEKELKDLIKELHDKLLLAAEFYNVIQKKHPELLLKEL
ncbi:hypothetical protein NBRC116595_15110 [Aliiglaciecola sp. NS0011-25]